MCWDCCEDNCVKGALVKESSSRKTEHQGSAFSWVNALQGHPAGLGVGEWGLACLACMLVFSWTFKNCVPVNEFLKCRSVWLYVLKDLLAVGTFLFQLSRRSTKLGVKSQPRNCLVSATFAGRWLYKMSSLARCLWSVKAQIHSVFSHLLWGQPGQKTRLRTVRLSWFSQKALVTTCSLKGCFQGKLVKLRQYAVVETNSTEIMFPFKS